MALEEQFLMILDPGQLFDEKLPDPVATPDVWMVDVRAVLQKIANSKVGNILLRSIRYHGRWVRIEPYLPSKQISAACNATAGPPEDKDILLNFMPFFAKRFGAVVRFTPQWYRSGTPCEKKHKDSGGYFPTSDEVLIHELVHAFRNVSQKRLAKNDPANRVSHGMSLYDTKEEFYAILVTNIYHSEIKGPLRGSRHSGGHFPIEKGLDGSYEFFQISRHSFSMVDRFCKDHPGLTRALSQVKVPFNPIAAYYRNPRKAKELSRSKFATVRDILVNPVAAGASQLWGELLR